MPEPEELLIDAALRLARVAGRWRKRSPPPVETTLEHHRRRLELLVAAACGEGLELLPAQPPAPRTLLGRLFGAAAGPADAEQRALPVRSGRNLFLPPVLPEGLPLDPPRFYRILALHHAARRTPPPLPSRLAAELFLIVDALRAERRMVAAFPGLADDFTRLRAACLKARPPLAQLTPTERAVEIRYRGLLRGATPGVCASPPEAAMPLAFEPELPAPGCDAWDDSDGAERWAIAAAERARGGAEHGAVTTAERARGNPDYRGLMRDWWLGGNCTAAGPLPEPPDPAGPDPRPPRTTALPRAPRPRRAAEDEDDSAAGPLMLHTGEPLPHAEDARGLQRPADQGEADPHELADSLSELPELRTVRTPGPVAEALAADRPGDAVHGPAAEPHAATIWYPEWDYRRAAYRRPGAGVELRAAREGDGGWAARVLAARPALAARLRRQMQRLRPQRVRLRAQPEGEEIDLDACVRAAVERGADSDPDARVYSCTRPLRRELALTLLVDVSGSTDRWVARGLHGIEVAREALLFICVALDAAAVPFSILAFSGERPGRVTVQTVKSFAEGARGTVHRRIAALESERFTRLGAALRHAAGELQQRRERRRVLLLISDGRPYDADCYGSRYGVEDSRRAVLEARRGGAHCVCLAVDARPSPDLAAIFGVRGYRVLASAAQLPEVTAHLVKTWSTP